MKISEQIRNAKVVDWLGEGLSQIEIKQTKELALIAAKIEFKRHELSMTQAEFAAKMGVSQGMVSKWESGEYNFTIATLNNICEKLDLIFEPMIKEKERILESEYSVLKGVTINAAGKQWGNFRVISNPEQLEEIA